MKDMWLRIGGFILVASIAYLFIFSFIQGFAPFEYADFPIEDSLIKAEEEMAQGISRAVWDTRSVDTVILAFLLVVASACCATILNSEKEAKK